MTYGALLVAAQVLGARLRAWCALQLANVLSTEQLFYACILPFIAFFGVFAFIMYPLRETLHPTGLVFPWLLEMPCDCCSAPVIELLVQYYDHKAEGAHAARAPTSVVRPVGIPFSVLRRKMVSSLQPVKSSEKAAQDGVRLLCWHPSAPSCAAVSLSALCHPSRS